MGANGYWAPLLTLLRHLSAEGFAPANLAQLAEPLADVAALGARLPPAPPK
jgi:hypothetical protein